MRTTRTTSATPFLATALATAAALAVAAGAGCATSEPTPNLPGEDASVSSPPEDASTPVVVSPCADASPSCLPGTSDFVLDCADDRGFFARRCEDGMLCHKGVCLRLTCLPGTTECDGSAVRTCNSDGMGYGTPVPCEADQACQDGECVPLVCTPDSVQCNEQTGAPERCNAAGTAWEPGAACAGETTCVDGTCLPAGCSPGDLQCGPASTLYTCDAQGIWVGQQCPAGQPCVFNRCVECVSADVCEDWEDCTDGVCAATVPAITTDSLPATSVNSPYSVTLQAEGGKAPLGWAITAGALPGGLQLDSVTGELAGIPTVAASATFTVTVTDALGASDSKQLELEVAPAGELVVITRSLPEGEVDEPYSATLEASGGQAPYGWLALTGQLPTGIDLFSNGTMTGTPQQPGSFAITFRVFDGSTPPRYTDQPLTLTIRIAPLNITGDQTYNLLFTKLVVMPTLVQLVPYNEKLTAKGGLRPHTWTEEEPPLGLSFLISSWGLPEGLTLAPDGRVSGWVTDVSDAITFNFPGLPTMTGYFDYVKVTDAQSPADTDTGIVVLPTVPIIP